MVKYAAGKGAGNGGGRYAKFIEYKDIYTNNEDTYMKDKDKPKIFSNFPDVLTAEDLSRMLGISTKTAYKHLKEKKIKSVTIGRTYKIPKVYVLQYLQILE